LKTYYGMCIEPPTKEVDTDQNLKAANDFGSESSRRIAEATAHCAIARFTRF